MSNRKKNGWKEHQKARKKYNITVFVTSQLASAFVYLVASNLVQLSTILKCSQVARFSSISSSSPFHVEAIENRRQNPYRAPSHEEKERRNYRHRGSAGNNEWNDRQRRLHEESRKLLEHEVKVPQFDAAYKRDKDMRGRNEKNYNNAPNFSHSKKSPKIPSTRGRKSIGFEAMKNSGMDEINFHRLDYEPQGAYIYEENTYRYEPKNFNFDEMYPTHPKAPKIMTGNIIFEDGFSSFSETFTDIEDRELREMQEMLDSLVIEDIDQAVAMMEKEDVDTIIATHMERHIDPHTSLKVLLQQKMTENQIEDYGLQQEDERENSQEEDIATLINGNAGVVPSLTAISSMEKGMQSTFSTGGRKLQEIEEMRNERTPFEHKSFQKIRRDQKLMEEKANKLFTEGNSKTKIKKKDPSAQFSKYYHHFSSEKERTATIKLEKGERMPPPTFIPNGGFYPVATGVELNGPDGTQIKYSFDNSLPESEWTEIPSGDIIHLVDSNTIYAYTKSVNSNASARSVIVSQDYTVPNRHYGSAYLVPYHNQKPDFSGKTLNLNLRTDDLSYVRIHNVKTDFANYYGTKGQQPYTKNHVSSFDMSSVDSDLKGFQGGFSALCNGKQYGIYVPYFNGKEYFGKITRLHHERYSNSSSKSSSFSSIDLSQINERLVGFSGGFASGCKGFLSPYFNGYEFASIVVKFDIGNFTLANVETIDLREISEKLAGYFGGFQFDDEYGYLVPYRNVRGPVGKVNTRFTVDGFKDVNMVEATATNGGDLLRPSYHGILVRFSLHNFTTEYVEYLDLTLHDPDLRGYSGGFTVGSSGILVPYRNIELAKNQGFFSKVVKFDLKKFNEGMVAILDLSHKDKSLKGFVGGFAYGKYGLLVPYSNGMIEKNWQGRAEFGAVVRIDVNDFSLETTKSIDLTDVYRQQVPSYPVRHLRGFVQGFALGKFIYFCPYFNSVRSGLIPRIDMTDFDLYADLQAAGNSTDITYVTGDGVQIIDLTLHDPELVGFSGCFPVLEDGDY